MEINKYMFREYDIRGVWGKDINPEVSYLIGRAFGTKLVELGKKETIIGYDNRKSSPIIEENLVRGIRECGVDVVRLGLVTTPMYYSSWDFLNIRCGLMITASHNPKDDNGFKFSYNGLWNAYGESSLELYNIIINNKFYTSDKLGNVRNEDIRDRYLEQIVGSVDLDGRRLKVVYDCGNGTTCVVADDIFNEFSDKLDLIPLFNDSNPDFPNHHPDPAVEENLAKLKEKVLEVGADIGIAFDGDGDRIGVVDEKGHMLNIDMYMIIIWRYLSQILKDKRTFYDVKCSLALKEELEKLGVEGEFYRTGNSYSKMKSYEGNYPFGGELSGHVFFRDKHPGYDDGIYGGLRLIEVLMKSNKPLSQMLEGIPVYYSTPELKIKSSDDIKFQVIDKVLDYCKNREYNILTLDGVKVLFSDGAALVRASNTGPNITCRFEAKNENRLEEIKKEFMDLVDEYNK